MSLLDRVLDALDAPRFCRDDGQPIEVERVTRFDSWTGAEKDWWCWHCPDVSVTYEGGAIRWSQMGAYRVHDHGAGRPRWHRLSTPEPGQ